MSQPLQTQTSPDRPGCPTVLIEGRPVVVLGLPSSTASSTEAEALPRVLAEGRPVAVLSSDRTGSATVLGGRSE